MCVAVPGRIVSIGEPTAASIPARVQLIDSVKDADLVMVPEAGMGDYVMVHSGYAIRVVPREEAIEAREMLRLRP